MNIRQAVITVALSCCLGTAGAQTWEIQGVYDYYSPQKSVWESQAHGGEFRLIYWWERSDLGLLFSAGYTQWNVREHALVQTDALTQTLGGRADYIPIGLSVIERKPLQGYRHFHTTFELGVRYLFCDSKMTVTEISNRGAGPLDVETYPMGCEDGLVGRVAAGLEFSLTDSRNPLRIVGTVGYQFDIDRGRASESEWVFYSEDIDLEAFYVQLGLAIPIR